jgi:hypothetical protein
MIKGKNDSVEIPDQTSLKEDNVETIFHRYRRGDVCRDTCQGRLEENYQKDNFRSATVAGSRPRER